MQSSLRDAMFPSSMVYCNAEVLDALQNSPHRPFSDSKTLVDLDLSHPPTVILRRFSQLPHPLSENDYFSFVYWAFQSDKAAQTSRVVPAAPPDITPSPPAFAQQGALNGEALAFVNDLKQRWTSLCRKFRPHTALSCCEQSSIIPLPHPFFVSGGRFREMYYWDTLWVVKGLLACDMKLSAMNCVRNLLHLVQMLGFVPNGNRVYYLNRSQPPVLTEAVLTVYEYLESREEQIEWLKEAVPVLDKEHSTFHANHSLSVIDQMDASSGCFSIYKVTTNCARPESYREDTRTVDSQMSSDAHPFFDVEKKKRSLFQNLAAGAESGWDFSSRWFKNDSIHLKDIDTENVIPCCLNGILYKAETSMMSFHQVLQQRFEIQLAEKREKIFEERVKYHATMYCRYEKRSAERKRGIMKHMWDGSEAFWFDISRKDLQKRSTVSCAALIAAWSGVWEGVWTGFDASSFVSFLTSKSGLLHQGGLSCTATRCNEQWDYPNSWPPLVDFAVEGLLRIHKSFPQAGAKSLADKIAGRFIGGAFECWKREEVLHEKYDASAKEGRRGEGGEYLPQVGFGWTNGCVLWMLKRDGKALQRV